MKICIYLFGFVLCSNPVSLTKHSGHLLLKKMTEALERHDDHCKPAVDINVGQIQTLSV